MSNGSTFAAAIPRTKLGIAVSAALAAMVIAGCGSSDDDKSNTSSTAAPATATTTTAATPASSKDDVLAGLFKGTENPPPTSGPPIAKGKTVWWVSCGEVVPACSQPAKSAAEAAKTMGIKFKIVDGKLGVGGAYPAGVRAAIAAKADAIIVHAVPCPLLVQPLQEAKAAGIKTIDVESAACPSSGPQFTGSMQYNDAAPTAEDYFRTWGSLSGEYLAAATDGKAKVLEHVDTDPLGGPIAEGFEDALSKCSGCKVVGKVNVGSAMLTPNGPWITSFRSKLLQSGANSTFMQFGAMLGGLGGVKAIKDAGQKWTIVGGNGESDTMDLVRDGSVAACTGCHDSNWMGYGAMDEVNRLLNGQPTVPQGIGQRAVDKTHIDEVSAGAGSPYKSPIDWKAAYEKLWASS